MRFISRLLLRKVRKSRDIESQVTNLASRTRGKAQSAVLYPLLESMMYFTFESTHGETYTAFK